MQLWLIALGTVERLGSRGWTDFQTVLEARDLALTGHPGVEPHSLKGRTKREVSTVCAMKPVSSKEICWPGNKKCHRPGVGGWQMCSWSLHIPEVPQVPPRGDGEKEATFPAISPKPRAVTHFEVFQGRLIKAFFCTPATRSWGSSSLT